MSNILQHPPRHGEVWTVDDKQVRLHDDGRVMKGPRPVLILMADEQNIDRLKLANVVPLTTSDTPDAITIQITPGYEDKAPGFVPDPNSCAVLLFYQPIETKFFCKYRGRIDQITQVMLKSIIQSKIIGIADFDFNP